MPRKEFQSKPHPSGLSHAELVTPNRENNQQPMKWNSLIFVLIRMIVWLSLTLKNTSKRSQDHKMSTWSKTHKEAGDRKENKEERNFWMYAVFLCVGFGLIFEMKP